MHYPFAAQNAVGPLTLQAAQGERVLPAGPSGCEKPTLLHNLSGLIPRHESRRDGSAGAIAFQ
ncbi:MAG: ABC transporter ATP-binding protein, partial [Paracoccaceae bacterium]